ncbi:MAG: glycosyltransferase [Mobilitalea sp.]
MDENQIMVSVFMLTYQHKRYVQQAIDSVLAQKVNFNYEIVISDDCSSDGTQQILIDYKRKYPNKIKLNLNKKNVGPVRNSKLVLKNCKGRYIAFLEGDDFWCNENKLQIQTDFLESNHEFSACYHNANVIGDNPKKCKYYSITKKNINNHMEYFKLRPTIPTASLVIRNIYKTNNYLQYFNKSKFVGDRIVHTLALNNGKIKYLDFTMSTYRYITNGGTSFSSKSIYLGLKDYIKAVKVQRDLVDQETTAMVESYITELQYNIVNMYQRDRLYKELLKYLFIELSVKEKMKMLFYQLKKIKRF